MVLLRIKEVNRLNIISGYVDGRIGIEALPKVSVLDSTQGQGKGAGGSASW